jgi:imidazolonepropionase-like amidohydrolase
MIRVAMVLFSFGAAVAPCLLRSAVAQDPAAQDRVSRDAETSAPSIPLKPFVLRAARMLDMDAGVLIADPVVVVEGDRIAAINPAALPAGAAILDLGDTCLLPGLIDMHTHLTGDLEGDWRHRDVEEGPADWALRGARNAARTLQAGFTTVRDVGAGGFADIALMHAIEAGWIEGPRMFAAGHPIGITGGHCDASGYAPGVLERGPREGVADGPDEVRKAVRYQIKHGAKVIKTCATAGVLSFEGPVGAQQLSQEELEALVDEARRHGLRVAAHAHGTDGILAAVRAGVDSIEHGSELSDEAIALMKERGTFLVPTTHLADAIDLETLPDALQAKARSILPTAKESVARAIAAGVPIAFGTDASVIPHGQNAKEFAALCRRGMSPLEAIRSATLNAAALLGVADRGRIAPGALADVIAVPGNPLENITSLEHVVFVMKAGAVVKAP